MGKPRSKKRRRRPGRSVRTETLDLTIDQIGGRGDGVAEADGRRYYVPFSLPGETVCATVHARQGDGFAARLDEVLSPSADRQTAPCPHFGACGGCQLQHMSATAYADWVRNEVVTALARRGLADAPVDAPVLIPPGTRRRVALAVKGGNVGFLAKGSHTLVSVDRCLLLSDGVNSFLPPLRQVAKDIPGIAQIQITGLAVGADIVVTGPREMDLSARERLAAFAHEAEVAGVSWRGRPDDPPEPVAQRVPSVVSFAGIDVAFPSGAFLQPSVEGEAALVGLVSDWLGGAHRIVDLFCGLGTFTFPLSGIAPVHGVEGNPEMTRAIESAAGRAGMAGRVAAECRDLFANPLTEVELCTFDAAIFDPPRAGAKEQALLLASATSLKRIAAVSCNPSTFARDVRALVDGGFTLERVVPVDQFPYSPHGEVVGLLSR